MFWPGVQGWKYRTLVDLDLLHRLSTWKLEERREGGGENAMSLTSFAQLIWGTSYPWPRSWVGSLNINNVCVANNRNVNVNINNLVYIDCSNDFRERTPHFRISCINTQSCCNKTEMISDQLIEQDIDILCITETWLHEYGLAMLRPPGYEIKSFPRIDQRGGGVAFIYRLSSFTIRTSEWSLTSHKTFEIATCSFQTSHNKLTIVCIYRPSSRKLRKTSTDGEETFFHRVQRFGLFLASTRTPICCNGRSNHSCRHPHWPVHRAVSVHPWSTWFCPTRNSTNK